VVYRGEISVILHHPLPRIIAVLRNEQFTINRNIKQSYMTNSYRAKYQNARVLSVCAFLYTA